MVQVLLSFLLVVTLSFACLGPVTAQDRARVGWAAILGDRRSAWGFPESKLRCLL